MVRKSFIPFAHSKSIYDIDICFYKSFNIKYLFLDLDNTLDSYKTLYPSERALKLISDLKENGITPIIISNNHSKRVINYSKVLGIECVCNSMKPFSFKIIKILKTRNINYEAVMMVGDQLMTDIKAGNKAKIKTIYTEKIVKEDQLTTRFNRIFEKNIKKQCIKENLFIEWSDILNGKNN